MMQEMQTFFIFLTKNNDSSNKMGFGYVIIS